MSYLESRDEIREVEADLDLSRISCAIYFPDSGVVCSDSLLRHYEYMNIDMGSVLLCRHKVINISYDGHIYHLTLQHSPHHSNNNHINS